MLMPDYCPYCGAEMRQPTDEEEAKDQKDRGSTEEADLRFGFGLLLVCPECTHKRTSWPTQAEKIEGMFRAILRRLPDAG